MNTVIYARYSAGPRQTDQSIEGQLRVCTDFCKQRGLTVIDTYCDRHISGRTDERPEFQRLIASTNLIAGRTPEVTIVVLPYGFVLATQIKDRL